MFATVSLYAAWIKQVVGSGFTIAGEDDCGNSDCDDISWKPNDAFCEYIIEDG